MRLGFIVLAALTCWAFIWWLSRVGWLAHLGVLVLGLLFVASLFDVANEWEAPDLDARRFDRAIRHATFSMVFFAGFVGVTLCLGK